MTAGFVRWTVRVSLGMVSFACLAIPVGSLVNGNFTSGDLTGWTSAGTAMAVGAQGNAVPVSGSFQALVASGSDGEGEAVQQKSGLAAARVNGPRARKTAHVGQSNPNDPTYTDVPVANIETALNLPSGAIAAALPNDDSPTNGSAMWQTFTATAGSTISFSWNFATNEEIPSHFDAALYSVQVGAAPAQVFELADTSQGSVLNADAGTGSPFTTMTGYHTITIPVTTTGTYTIGFVSMQTDDDEVTSGTYISNVQAGTAPPATPVPPSFYLALLGIAMLSLYFGLPRLRRASH